MSGAERSLHSSLPEELIQQILIRLPRKSLLRSRCVSKGMLHLIDCPMFKKRFEITHTSVSHFTVMFIEARRLFYMYFHLPDAHNSSSELQVNIPLLKDPTFIGCCKGIVCLMVKVKPLFESYFLLNPFNGTFRKLERCNLRPLSCMFSIGFGYDYATDDYKIVRLEPAAQGNNILCLDVHSMRSDSSSSRIIRNFSPGCSGNVIGIFVESAIHWLWLDMNVCVCIAAFDLETESLRSVPLPPQVEIGQVKLHELGGRLCVFVESSNSSTIVWVMKEYGVETSWTPLFNVANEIKVIIGHFPLWDDARLLCYESGSRLWMWLNTQDGSKEDIQIHKLPRQQVHNALVYGTQSWICVRSQLRLGSD